MSATLSQLLDAGTVARATQAETSHPNTARVIAREIPRAALAHQHSDDVSTVALLIGLGILASATHDDADTAEVTRHGRTIARQACRRAAPAVASDHYRAGRMDVPEDLTKVSPVASTDDDIVTEVLLSLPWAEPEAAPDAITRWTVRDTLTAMIECADATLTAEALAVPKTARRGPDTLTGRLAASRDLRAGRATKALTEALAVEQDDLQGLATDVLRWATDLRPQTRRPLVEGSWDEYEAVKPTLGSHLPGAPAGKGHRTSTPNMFGEVIVRDLGEVIVLTWADSGETVTTLDPYSQPLALDYARGMAEDPTYCTHEHQRTSTDKDADRFAQALEPMGPVAKPNTRKNKRSGKVGTSTIPVGARR